MDSLNIPFTVLCAVSSGAIAWYGAYNSLKKKTEDKTEKRAKLEAQVEYIYMNVGEIKEALNQSVIDRRNLSERVSKVENEVTFLKEEIKNIKKEG